jgi:ferredoxin-nitrite reductase
MASPTAGLDTDAAVDTRPLVRALDRHIATHPHLAPLPAKLSFGLDGGERASIAHLPNDVLFRAYRDASGEARFRVVVRIGKGDGASVDLGSALAVDQVVEVAAEIAEVYLGLLPPDGSKPRLRHLLAGLGLQAIQQLLWDRVPALMAGGPGVRLPTLTEVRAPVGVHAQRTNSGKGMTYIGLVPFVAGRLTTAQLRRLAALAERYGSGTLRLSPWRSVVLPDVPPESVEVVQAELDQVGMPSRAPSLASGIVTCAGSAGCGSGSVDTVRDALALSTRLTDIASASDPLNIHLSGCEKCCAQRRPADITLLGRPGDDERYALYVRGEGDTRLGRLMFDALAPDDALAMVARLVAEAQALPTPR